MQLIVAVDCTNKRQAEGACEVNLAYHEDVIELDHVVDALCEQLAFHLVGDLVHAVSPVGHAFFSWFLSVSV